MTEAQSEGAPARDAGFGNSVPAWRARRLRARLHELAAAGAAAGRAGEARIAPAELAHRAERRRWLRGWASVSPQPEPPPPPPEKTARQAGRLSRWQAAAGRLRAEQGARRAAIIEAVADEMLADRPLKFGAIAAAHRETVRRCREAGLPAPKAARYRRWLKAARDV